MEWENYCGVVTPADAADVERILARGARTAPADLRKVLTEHQGQTPVREVCPFPKGGNAAVGPILISTPRPADPAKGASTETYTIEYALQSLKEWSQADDGLNLFPFATDTASGWYCIDQRQEAQPVVYVWMEAYPDEPEGIIYLAPGVTDFLAMLTN